MTVILMSLLRSLKQHPLPFDRQRHVMRRMGWGDDLEVVIVMLRN